MTQIVKKGAKTQCIFLQKWKNPEMEIAFEPIKI